MVINPRNFKIKDSFNELMRPLIPEALQDEALKVNKKTREELAAARHPEAVWKDFTAFVNKFNFKKTPFTAPIPAGYNIRNFDMPILQKLCELYGPIDKKHGNQVLFSSFDMWDLSDDIFRWTENNNAIPNRKLDTIREWWGCSKDGAHDALRDCLDTSQMIIKFMRLYRHLFPKIPFENCMAK